MDEKLTFLQCQTSAAHTFGNVTAFVQNWLINQFPKDFFKTVHIHSKIAHRQLRSTPKEFLKKTKPMLILRPRIDWNDQDVFLKGTLLTTNLYNQYCFYGGGNLQEFIYDREHELAVRYLLNRRVINFDVIIVFSTFMQQTNFASYLSNRVMFDIPFDLETCLESYIPLEMMEVIADTIGIPIYDEVGSTKKFLDYINGKTIYPITYKLQGSTGTDEFYRYYPVNIFTTLSSFSVDEGNVHGHITSNYQITFNIRCEFNTTGLYYIFSDKIDRMRTITVPDDGSLIPIFTDVLMRDDFNIREGWSLFNSPMVMLENYKHDTVNFKKALNNSILTVVKMHRDRGVPIDQFIEIKVRQQGKLLRNGVDFIVNWDTLDIDFYKCTTFYTYKIMIYIDVKYINDLLKDEYGLK